MPLRASKSKDGVVRASVAVSHRVSLDEAAHLLLLGLDADEQFTDLKFTRIMELIKQGLWFEGNTTFESRSLQDFVPGCDSPAMEEALMTWAKRQILEHWEVI